MTGALSAPRFIVIRSLGSLFNVYDRVAERTIENGARFQPDAARAEAERLNAAAARDIEVVS